MPNKNVKNKPIGKNDGIQKNSGNKGFIPEKSIAKPSPVRPSQKKK